METLTRPRLFPSQPPLGGSQDQSCPSGQGFPKAPAKTCVPSPQPGEGGVSTLFAQTGKLRLFGDIKKAVKRRGQVPFALRATSA